MANQELNTIPEKESDEFIKSNIEDLVPIPSESEDTSESDTGFTSHSFFDANKDECFDSGGDDDEINVFDYKESYDDSEEDILYLKSLLNDDLVYRDPCTLIMSVVSILEGFTDEPPLEENDDLFDLEPKNDDWKNILYDAPIDDLMTKDKVFNLGIHDQIFSPTYVSLPFTDHHYIFYTYVIRLFLPHFTYPVVSPSLISSGSEDAIFNPDIFAFHFSHRCENFISFNVYTNILNESPMEIYSSTRFTPNIMMIWGESI
uniref:Uncharacterized protein n=1 Tax=Tanacetum cinerariifolium TaxID=118510 RepID=A0A6L2K169_TANCI|nr:hypothetical protein [Tanacetum cinerariifolium]